MLETLCLTYRVYRAQDFKDTLTFFRVEYFSAKTRTNPMLLIPIAIKAYRMTAMLKKKPIQEILSLLALKSFKNTDRMISIERFFYC
jgi:hypothetical protein